MQCFISNSSKSKAVQKIINEALDILESVGIPFNTKSERGLERMAVCFLAVAGVTKDWKKAKSSEDNIHLKTRDIITRESITNAVRVAMILGGSTNLILHYLAIAKAASVKFIVK